MKLHRQQAAGIISEEYDVNRPGTHSAVDRSFYDTIILLDFSNETVWAKNTKIINSGVNKKKIVAYHHCSAKRDNIAKTETTDYLLLYLSLNSCRYIYQQERWYP